MIKVELMYKVTMYGTDWMMTEEEYKEFRETALNLPLATIYPRVESIKPIDFISDVESAIAKYGENVVFQKPVDQAEECPDYIDPPAAEVVPEKVVEVQKEPEKVPIEAKDFTPYIKMYREHTPGRVIQLKMVHELGMTQSAANNYYYTGVKKAAEAEIEAEKKEPEKKMDKSVQVVPAKIYDKPADGKYFSDEDRLALQRKVGVK